MKKSTSTPSFQLLQQPQKSCVGPRTQNSHISHALGMNNYPVYPPVGQQQLETTLSPYYYNAAYNTATCFSQLDDVKDIAACVASPPEIVDEWENNWKCKTFARQHMDVNGHLSRFEEFYRVFRRNRKKKEK